VTYFTFLAVFLVLPLLGLLLGIGRLRGRGAGLPSRFGALRPIAAIALMAAVAIVYTTPWDNYLVATGVWSYDPSLVAGVTLGYVPVEEYLFFILQTLLTGAGLVALALQPGAAVEPPPASGRLRIWTVVPLLGLWLVACFVLASNWYAARYLALLFAWGLPPILIQMAYGADLLWSERRIVLPAIMVATAYYSAADILAVASGTWSFHPSLTLGLRLGLLPIEEILFFLLTNVLIVFSMSLLLSTASMERFRRLVGRAGALVSKAGDTAATASRIL
jgi:lycopene cyclase domain-containing protein